LRRTAAREIAQGRALVRPSANRAAYPSRGPCDEGEELAAHLL
jgi:hypothetical protein